MGGDFTKDRGNRTRTFGDLVIILIIAVSIFVTAHVFDLFEMIAELSWRHEAWNIDEFIVVSAILAFAFGIFSFRRWRELRNEMAEHEQAEREIKKLNEDLKRRTIELEAANKELEAFSYSVSHDLRTPLIAIGGLSRKLFVEHSHHLDSKGKHYLNIIQVSAKNTCQLIDDLLSFFHLVRREIEGSDIDMGELAKVLFKELKNIAPERKVKLKIKPIPVVHGDRAMIRQVFTNLLSNAFKFTRGKETGVIEIGGWIQNGQNIFYVKDNGVGFAMEKADQLFGVFQRLHSPEDYEGNGVGLALVQRIIQRHGGRVWAEGKVNEGATFYFSLPSMVQGEEGSCGHEVVEALSEFFLPEIEEIGIQNPSQRLRHPPPHLIYSGHRGD
jgi:signal transduction histidine kinase